ncbi:unnamed protein product, partial [Mesorhabditis spiculigera]
MSKSEALEFLEHDINGQVDNGKANEQAAITAYDKSEMPSELVYFVPCKQFQMPDEKGAPFDNPYLSKLILISGDMKKKELKDRYKVNESSETFFIDETVPKDDIANELTKILPVDVTATTQRGLPTVNGMTTRIPEATTTRTDKPGSSTVTVGTTEQVQTIPVVTRSTSRPITTTNPDTSSATTTEPNVVTTICSYVIFKQFINANSHLEPPRYRHHLVRLVDNVGINPGSFFNKSSSQVFYNSFRELKSDGYYEASEHDGRSDYHLVDLAGRDLNEPGHSRNQLDFKL